jgi:hypothetical protein
MNRVPRNLERRVEGPRPSAQPARPMFAVTQSVIAESERWLRSPPWRGRESIVYWTGVKREDLWLVTTVIRPRAVTTRGSFSTSAEDNARVIDFLCQAGLALLAQVHTHAGDYVDHSAGDDEDAFMPKENSISIVVPHYGRRGMGQLDRCGVHRYESGRFRRLHPAEIDAQVCIVPTSRNLAI